MGLTVPMVGDRTAEMQERPLADLAYRRNIARALDRSFLCRDIHIG